MKILHVVHGFPPEVIGGTELYVRRLVDEQRARGHDVSVFTGSVDWKPEFTVERTTLGALPVTRVHREDLYFDRWDKGFHPLVTEAFAAELRARAPDLVHVHHWIRLSSNLVATAAQVGVPAIVTAHDLFTTCPRVFRLKAKGGGDGDEACASPMAREVCVPCVPRWRFQKDDEIERSLARYRADLVRELALARVVLAPSRSHADFLASMLGFAAARIEALPHGTLVDHAPGGAPPAPARGTDGKLHLVSWGNLHPIKGAHLLLEALALADTRAGVRVHFFGEFSTPEYRERLETLARGLDVVFHGGYRSGDLDHATIDVAVLPTLARESYSFILDEAARLGVPILAADAGALAERATGRVLRFARNDAKDFGAKIDQLARDPARLDAMRRAPAPAVATFAEHAARLEAHCARAVALGPPAAPANDDAERLRDEWQRRETAFRELVRIEKWEDVVEEQRRRIAELEQALRKE